MQDFDEFLINVKRAFFELKKANPISEAADIPLGKRGEQHFVYTFSRGEICFYVGRTDTPRQRYRQHISGDRNSASFAFILARSDRECSQLPEMTRAKLEKDPVFQPVFKAKKKEVSKMEFRLVQVSSEAYQYQLEFLTACQLKAKHSKFYTH